MNNNNTNRSSYLLPSLLLLLALLMEPSLGAGLGAGPGAASKPSQSPSSSGSNKNMYSASKGSSSAGHGSESNDENGHLAAAGANSNDGDQRSSSQQQPGQSLNELLGAIFGNYHKELVPKRPTTVKMDLLLLKVKSTVEKEGIFESVVALFIEWQDDRLLWNPREFDNVSILAFDSDKVWLPDIAMTNSADHLYSISKDTRFVVRVSHDGAMKFVPTGTARTWCDLKLLTFPFDIQTCSLEFESWSLDSSTMTFNKSSDALVDDAFASPQWALCKRQAIVYDHYYNFTGETFTRVRFDFIVRRKSTFYIINLIFPCATLSLIQLLVFVIPSTDSTSDRVGFGTTNLLTLVVFQTIVTEEMPKSSDAVTALSKYVIALIIISAVGIFESVIAERMLRTTASPPPQWASKLMRLLPQLWSSQLPTGITQMILEGDFDSDSSSDDDSSSSSSSDVGGGDDDLDGIDVDGEKVQRRSTTVTTMTANSNNSNNNNNNNNKTNKAKNEQLLVRRKQSASARADVAEDGDVERQIGVDHSKRKSATTRRDSNKATDNNNNKESTKSTTTTTAKQQQKPLANNIIVNHRLDDNTTESTLVSSSSPPPAVPPTKQQQQQPNRPQTLQINNNQQLQQTSTNNRNQESGGGKITIIRNHHHHHHLQRNSNNKHTTVGSNSISNDDDDDEGARDSVATINGQGKNGNIDDDEDEDASSFIFTSLTHRIDKTFSNSQQQQHQQQNKRPSFLLKDLAEQPPPIKNATDAPSSVPVLPPRYSTTSVSSSSRHHQLARPSATSAAAAAAGMAMMVSTPSPSIIVSDFDHDRHQSIQLTGDDGGHHSHLDLLGFSPVASSSSALMMMAGGMTATAASSGVGAGAGAGGLTGYCSTGFNNFGSSLLTEEDGGDDGDSSRNRTKNGDNKSTLSLASSTLLLSPNNNNNHHHHHRSRKVDDDAKADCNDGQKQVPPLSLSKAAKRVASISDEEEEEDGDNNSGSDDDDRNSDVDVDDNDDPAKSLQRDQMMRVRNGRLWGILVTKLDGLTFTTCMLLAVGIPLGLFVPLILSDGDKCPMLYDG